MSEKDPTRDDELDERKDQPERDSDAESEHPRPVTPSDVEQDLVLEDRFEASDN